MLRSTHLSSHCWVIIIFLYSSPFLVTLYTEGEKRSLNKNYFCSVAHCASLKTNQNVFPVPPLLRFESWPDDFKGSNHSSLSTAGRSQCSVGAQGSTAWVWGEQRPSPQRHEPHQGRPGHLHRQLTPLRPRAQQEDCRVSTEGIAQILKTYKRGNIPYQSLESSSAASFASDELLLNIEHHTLLDRQV